ncbi:hypothetical protein F5Y17DRAFT_378357 [Xylariaceae sp. FL0594]|nr:hypothetical protein F5Y17DRAFT_378357 [Xylariaceae sp. FL0594]
MLSLASRCKLKGLMTSLSFFPSRSEGIAPVKASKGAEATLLPQILTTPSYWTGHHQVYGRLSRDCQLIQWGIRQYCAHLSPDMRCSMQFLKPAHPSRAYAYRVPQSRLMNPGTHVYEAPDLGIESTPNHKHLRPCLSVSPPLSRGMSGQLCLLYKSRHRTRNPHAV